MCGRLNLLQNVNLFGSGVTAGVISKSKAILEWSGSLTQYNWGNLDIDRYKENTMLVATSQGTTRN